MVFRADEQEAFIQRQATAAAMTSRGFTRAFPQATTAADFPKAVHDALALDALLTPEERDVRRRVRAFMVGSGFELVATAFIGPFVSS